MKHKINLGWYKQVVACMLVGGTPQARCARKAGGRAWDSGYRAKTRAKRAGGFGGPPPRTKSTKLAWDSDSRSCGAKHVHWPSIKAEGGKNTLWIEEG